jgi:predicted HicB family RNase H-like nuclease
VGEFLPFPLLCHFPSFHSYFFIARYSGDVNVHYQGLKYSTEKIEAIKNQAALKHETYLEDCVDAFVMLARNTSMTGMRIQVDAGLNVQGA